MLRISLNGDCFQRLCQGDSVPLENPDTREIIAELKLDEMSDNILKERLEAALREKNFGA